MGMYNFDPMKRTGPNGYINYKLSGGSGGSGGKGGNFGCGSLLLVIILALAFMNEIAKMKDEAFTKFFVWIGIVVIIVAVIHFWRKN